MFTQHNNKIQKSKREPWCKFCKKNAKHSQTRCEKTLLKNPTNFLGILKKLYTKTAQETLKIVHKTSFPGFEIKIRCEIYLNEVNWKLANSIVILQQRTPLIELQVARIYRVIVGLSYI